MRVHFAALAALVLGSFPAARGLAAQDSSSVTGRVAGRVMDRATGRPLWGARILVDGRPLPAGTDLDGRYRTEPLPAGSHAVQASFIGYQPVRIDSVVVAAGEIAYADFALSAVPFEVAAIQVEAEAIARPSSDAGLLAIQQAAPTVSDGISAEAISRTPDADAADAVARVTGISVFDAAGNVTRIEDPDVFR